MPLRRFPLPGREVPIQFTVNTVSRCEGGQHIHLDITGPGGAAHRVSYHRDEIADEIASFDEARERVRLRLIAAMKEANATTPAQIKASWEGKTFRV